MTKSVVYAGIIGGVLGALLGFLLNRSFPPQTAKTDTPAASEVRPFADELIAKLKAGNNSDFLKALRPGFAELSDEEYNTKIADPVLWMREVFPKVFGQSIDFEFLREHSLGPNVSQFVYLERFQQTGVVWSIVCYNGQDGWKVVGFRFLRLEDAFAIVR